MSKSYSARLRANLIGMEFEQFRCLDDTGFTRMHFGRAQFPAILRAKSRGEMLLQCFRPARCDHASRVQRAAESVRCPSAAEWLQIGERNGRVAGNFAPGMKHRLGAIESFGRLSENFQSVLFHKWNEPRGA